MMKFKSLWVLGTAVLAALAGTGCTSAAATSEAAAQHKSTVMYVPFGEGSYVMVDQDNGSVFTVTMPEELYGLSGEKITPDALEKGNILDIYGNGIMLYSYPGQYPGVEKIQVVAQGKPSDADQYQSIVDGIYQEPDPSEPPSLNVEYRTSLAAVTAMITRGGYEWSYEDKDGQTQNTIACGAHVLQWPELNDLTLEGPTGLTLHFFTETPKEVTAVRWDSSLLGTEDIPEGESVPVVQKDGAFAIENAESGYVYLVKGTWERGSAEFGFLTK